MCLTCVSVLKFLCPCSDEIRKLRQSGIVRYSPAYFRWIFMDYSVGWSEVHAKAKAVQRDKFDSTLQRVPSDCLHNLRDANLSARLYISISVQMREIRVFGSREAFGDLDRHLAFPLASTLRVLGNDFLCCAQETKASVIPSHIPSHRVSYDDLAFYSFSCR